MQLWSGSSTTDVSQGRPGFTGIGAGTGRTPAARVRVFMKRGECAVAPPSDTIGLDIEAARRMLRQGRARALVIGPDRATGAVIRALHADFRSPILNVRSGFASPLSQNRGTLLIHDVSTLDKTDQDHLLQWLNLSPRGISVIAVASEPLFPLVQRGAFLPDLFYRLNLVVIDVTDMYAIVHELGQG
jgi:hypothetical protein